MSVIELIKKAAIKAQMGLDEYNHGRYLSMWLSVTAGNKLTIAELMDVRLYLGMSVD